MFYILVFFLYAYTTFAGWLQYGGLCSCKMLSTLEDSSLYKFIILQFFHFIIQLIHTCPNIHKVRHDGSCLYMCKGCHSNQYPFLLSMLILVFLHQRGLILLLLLTHKEWRPRHCSIIVVMYFFYSLTYSAYKVRIRHFKVSWRIYLL